MTNRPTSGVFWAEASGSQVVQPPDSVTGSGWAPRQRPPAQWFNWWQQTVGRWLDYHDGEINALTVSGSANTPQAIYLSGANGHVYRIVVASSGFLSATQI